MYAARLPCATRKANDRRRGRASREEVRWARAVHRQLPGVDRRQRVAAAVPERLLVDRVEDVVIVDEEKRITRPWRGGLCARAACKKRR